MRRKVDNDADVNQAKCGFVPLQLSAVTVTTDFQDTIQRNDSNKDTILANATF